MSFNKHKEIFFISLVLFCGIFGILVTPKIAKAWACGDALVDSRDSKSYTTVLIGTQCWMAQNLNIGTKVSGTSNQGTDCPSASEIEKYCLGDDDNHCSTRGGLYQWAQAMCGSVTAGAVGICPTGWHIPTHDEFTTLERAVCTSGTCATDFPYDNTTTGWRGTNEGLKLQSGGSSGFNVIYTGFRDSNTQFNNMNSSGYFWASVVKSGNQIWSRTIAPGFGIVGRGTTSSGYGYAVRCLKDPNTAPTITSISATSPVKGGSTITITPSGQTDADLNNIYLYCNETGTSGGQAPTQANTLCSQANTSYASPYTTATCTYTASGDATKTIYCRVYDGTEYSSEVSTTYTVDSTAPSSIQIASIAVNSSTQLTITAEVSTDPNLHATPYYFADVPGWQASNIYVATNLNSNTQYTYKVKVKDAAGNESAYSTAVSAYTKAPAPTNLVATVNNSQSITLSVDAFTNSSTASSGYFFQRASNPDKNSGWIQTNTWTDTDQNFSCNGESYTVKYRNADAIETSTITASARPLTCGGAGSQSSFNPGFYQTTTLTPVVTPAPVVEQQIPAITEPSNELSSAELSRLQSIIDTLKQLIQLILLQRGLK